MRTRILPAHKAGALKYALDVLRQHGVVAFPTDTVYGLGALAFDPPGIDMLYTVKGRDHKKAIAILLAGLDQLERVAARKVDEIEDLVRAFWPGPLTVILPRHPDVPPEVSAGATIAVRIPDHPLALALLERAGPLAVTSANHSGADNSVTAAEVLAQLGGRIDLILDGGRSPGGQPSTVLDCTGKRPVILREGPISLADIERALN